MRRVLWLVLILTLLAPLTLAVADSIDTEKLPSDPALVTGRLPNGLRYIIRPHQNPQGRVSIWLHVASGSLNETDTTRGLAHYLEHMAFNGSTNFPPGSVVPFFQSLGLAFGRDQNAFTSFDQTTYQLALPGGGRDVVDKGMLFMSDVAMRLSLDQALIDAERPVILEEKRTRASARQRVEELVGHPVSLEIEPGRFLVAQSGALVARVRATKREGANRFVVVDAGFNDLARPVMYGAYHAIEVVPQSGGAAQGPAQPAVVAGPLCESGDVFTQDAGGVVVPRDLPDTAVGDLVVIRDAGAYASSMASNYNTRPLAPEFLLERGAVRQIRRRQTIAELLALEE